MKYDVLIIGGGIVGLVAAHALARSTRLSIGVVEAQPEAAIWDEKNYHHRVSAISLASQRIFAKLNLWPLLRCLRVSPFTEMQVWDAMGGGEIRFSAQEMAEPALGFIIENNAMLTVLREQLKNYPQVTLHSNVELKTLMTGAEEQTCLTNGAESFVAKLIIGADGAHSWLRKQMDFQISSTDYKQQAIVATVKTTLPHEGIARQVFLPTGPLAFLPLAEPHLTSIVWSVPTDAATHLLNIKIEAFNHELGTAFSHRLGDVSAVSPRYAFPLVSKHSEAYVAAGLALIGDAAHVVHPLAGQGVNLGIQDAMSLSFIVARAVNQRRQYWSLASLRHYERERRSENMLMLKGIDGLHSLFTSPAKPIQFIRSLGLDGLNALPIKNIFTQYASKKAF